MNCQQARQLFSPWLDGELTDEERRAFGEHLTACRVCAAELEKLEAVTAAMRKMRVPVAPPEGFAALVTERLRRELEAAAVAGAGADAGGEAGEQQAEAAAAGKVVPLAGRVKPGRKAQEEAQEAGGGSGREAAGAAGTGRAVATAGQEKAGTGRAAGSGRVFARWWLGLRTGWRKSAAVAAALLMLLGGSATLAARYLGGPGIFNPLVVAEQAPLPPVEADRDQDMNVDRDATQPGSTEAVSEPGPADTAPGGGEERQPAAPGSGGANGERQMIAGNSPVNSPGTPGSAGQSAQKPAGEAGAGGDAKEPAATAAGSAPGSNAGVQPKVFLNQPRAIESMLIKVRVQDLDAAAAQLKAIAQAKGVSYSVEQKVQAAGGKAVAIFRLAAPQAQAGQFADYVSALGQVIERTRQTRDVSNEFAELLNNYQKLIAERKTASGEQAQKLDAEIKQKEAELEAMDREAREQVVLIVWLEQ